MCGIVGYAGPGNALGAVLQGLQRLEYRGYDSAGIAVATGSGGLAVEKRAGMLSNLSNALSFNPSEAFSGGVAIGHTRWATHGRPTDQNAHPHLSGDGDIAVVHNGIIENFARLRAELVAAGVEFRSDTDTEVIAHLLALEYASGRDAGDFVGSVYRVLDALEGAFTVAMVHAAHPDQLIAARRSTPLIIGVGVGEMFVGSDVAAFVAHTRKCVELGQDQVVQLGAEDYVATDFSGKLQRGRTFHVSWDVSAAEKAGHDFFMLKEIAEQPKAIADTLRGRLLNNQIVLDDPRLTNDDLREVEKVTIVACGTAFHAGLLAKYAIEHWAGLPVDVELASEFRHRDPVLNRRTLVVAISQSGETADTLEAVRHAKAQKSKVLAVCNTKGSQIPRESDAVLYTHAGPEIGVASTKCFAAQVVASYLVGLALAQARRTKYPDDVAHEFAQLRSMVDKVEIMVRAVDAVRTIARSLVAAKAILFIGRHVGYPVALEGALKLKELAYMHAEGFAAGELKHGPIALLEENSPVIVVMPSLKGRPNLHAKMMSNVQEMQARGARIIVLAEESDDAIRPLADDLIEIPCCPALFQPLVAVVPLQIIAAEVAQARGYDIDKPRNLAKSVTVE
ncbi:glutamine--fructose-6-phosphate transaminase (isomerizing) [Mycobacteroides abscessus]|uniref:glutamine--fructose-6-phosphate transaminase (isomerizing) n=1 Tax=Mycobacteroides abscessus TaxID=36809 RepID=UPI0021031B6E|nr:glutamine--fructose-6-phosphate transaminase (isomerizing) [Mycobacteroides abscessus]